MRNGKAVIFRRSMLERTSHSIELFMHKYSKYLVWAAFGFLACSLLYLLSSSDASVPPNSTDLLTTSGQAIEVLVEEAPQVKPSLEKDNADSLSEGTLIVKAKVRQGDSLGKILNNHGFTHAEIHEIANGIRQVDGHVTIFPDEIFEFHKDPKTQQVIQFTTETSMQQTLTVARVGDGFEYQVIDKPTKSEELFKAGTITNSLFADAAKTGMSDRIIMELAELFQWEIDFALDIRHGDEFKVIYENIYINDEKLRSGPILAAEFVNDKRVIRGYRYVHQDGTVGYYNEDGESLKKAFLRSPVDFARISSRFSLARKHPVLHKIRAHKGVDYAAPRGTPIKATGKGRITFAGRKGGYGNTLIIQHNEKHSTLYAHLNNFAKGIKAGTKVHQGQVIGAIGSTGLATGPHLHYEFRLNGQQVDPLRVKFPQAESLSAEERPKFLAQISPYQAKLTQRQSHQLATLNPYSPSMNQP